MSETVARPNISRRVFWDVDFETLDYEKDKDLMAMPALADFCLVGGTNLL